LENGIGVGVAAGFNRIEPDDEIGWAVLLKCGECFRSWANEVGDIDTWADGKGPHTVGL
jgi:hypothetical protein